MVQGDLGHEALEAGAILDAGSALAEVFVDDQDAVTTPAQINGAISQGVLQPSRLAILDDLPRRRLPDIDDRQSLSMMVVVFCPVAPTVALVGGSRVMMTVSSPSPSRSSISVTVMSTVVSPAAMVTGLTVTV